MEFRWVSLIALWTILSGPAFHKPDAGPRPADEAAAVSPARPRADGRAPSTPPTLPR